MCSETRGPRVPGNNHLPLSPRPSHWTTANSSHCTGFHHCTTPGPTCTYFFYIPPYPSSVPLWNPWDSQTFGGRLVVGWWWGVGGGLLRSMSLTERLGIKLQHHGDWHQVWCIFPGRLPMLCLILPLLLLLLLLLLLYLPLLLLVQ